MSQIFFELTSISQLDLVELPMVKGVIISDEVLSIIKQKISFSLQEMKQIVTFVHQLNKEVIINANNIFFENDLVLIDEIIEKYEQMSIDEYLYTDQGFYEIMKQKELTNKLIYQASTYLTNKYDCSIFQKKVDNIVLSHDLTKYELIEIINYLDKAPFIDVFGKWPLFHSRRPLLSNYFNYRHWDNNPEDNYHVVEELRSTEHEIIEDCHGTHLFSGGYYNLTNELQLNDIDLSLIISTSFLNNDNLRVIVKAYNDYLEGKLTINFFEDCLLVLNLKLTKGLLNEKSVLLKHNSKEGANLNE